MARCLLLDIPMQDGAGRRGCDMGPSALRAAGLAEALSELGHEVVECGTVRPGAAPAVSHPNPAIRRLPEVVAWTAAIEAAVRALPEDGVPMLLGGDHALGLGALPALAARAKAAGRPFFLLWLDAHSDCQTLATTTSGNLHGVPIARAIGDPSFDGVYPPPAARIDPARICMMGLRSVDPPERRLLAELGVVAHDMRAIDEHGVRPLLLEFLDRVRREGGALHVSLDVDFLDPAIAPGVGTTVPGGATFREAHLVMEMLSDSGLATSLDLAELNPFLDERGRTAQLLVDLAASLMGRRVLDRPTRSYG